MKTLIFALLPTVSFAADYHFCWHGENDYWLRGTMSIPDEALSKPMVTENDVTAFAIWGFHGQTALGKWSMAELTETSTWHLRFRPSENQFPTGGSHTGDNGQAWNANGSANDCGVPGFGFNSGTNAQDVCVNGRWITASSINRFKPFYAAPVGEPAPECPAPPLTG